MMMFRLRDKSSCLQTDVVGVNVGLAFIDAIIALLAFTQLLRIHTRNPQLGWNRQKVFHLLIGSSSLGYFVYFVLSLIASCNEWQCWSYFCGFIFMAFPKILYFAAFLLLLSFWADLCHQGDDEDEEDEEHGFLEVLLEKSLNIPSTANADGHSHRLCFPFKLFHVGSRQKIVILITALDFVLMVTFAVLIWIGKGSSSIDSSDTATVYIDLMAGAMLLLGGALAVYGLLLCLKMRKVRSERASSEVWKVASLAAVCLTCFTTSGVVALSTYIPILYWRQPSINGVYTSLLLIAYYFIGASVPSAFLLWVMRDIPPAAVPANTDEESRTIAYIHDSSATGPNRWTIATTSQNQISRASPI